MSLSWKRVALKICPSGPQVVKTHTEASSHHQVEAPLGIHLTILEKIPNQHPVQQKTATPSNLSQQVLQLREVQQ